MVVWSSVEAGMGRRGEGASSSSARTGGGCSGRLKRPRDEREEVWGPSARGIDGRPRSAARQRHGRACWVPRRRRGASPSSCRLRRARRLSGAQQDDVCAQVGESAARPGGSAAAARQRGRGSGAARHARAALKCLRVQSKEGRVSQREKREKEEWREKRKCQRFDLVQTQDLQLKLEKF